MTAVPMAQELPILTVKMQMMTLAAVVVALYVSFL